ncbi:MAG: hypothetical protein U9Q94_00590 [Candidatus Bipolaricaulota bacterium]|nr:hypothetical protein [Candidatus Bipolaricaulota bacterium]
MAVEAGLRRWYLVVFIALVVAVVAPFIVRIALHVDEPTVEIVSLDGTSRNVPLSKMKRMPVLKREGTYQNQFENWRDQGTYIGVRLTDIIGSAADYRSIRVIAADGYELSIERERVEDPDYPMILAYAFDGLEVPAWKMGFRIVVLPEDGAVSNAEYDAVSAGSFWVQNVERIVLQHES